MYLSRLVLDPRGPAARVDLADRYEMHRSLARAFAPSSEATPERFLWRLEPSGSVNSRAVVLVQSSASGNWEVLKNRPEYLVEIQENKEMPLAQWIAAGRKFRFRLFANPTVTRQGKRFGLSRECEQIAWLAAQAERHGFELAASQRSASERIQTRQKRSGAIITVQGALFDGILVATDPAALRLAVENGLGHGKAWGLGLLSLGRAG